MPEPKAHTFRDLAEIIEARIRAGVYPLGEKLPTQEEIADEFGLGLTTISKAVMILRERGLVTSRPPKGIFVADELPS